MVSRFRILTCFAAFACLLPLLGCSTREKPGVPVKGTVRADGEPLSGAVITFEPIRETTGPNASAAVFDGRFRLGSEAGLHGGIYRVRISLLPAEVRRSLPSEQQRKCPPVDAVIAPSFDAESNLTGELAFETENVLAFDVDFL